jgi:hypothetical protein
MVIYFYCANSSIRHVDINIISGIKSSLALAWITCKTAKASSLHDEIDLENLILAIFFEKSIYKHN